MINSNLKHIACCISFFLLLYHYSICQEKQVFVPQFEHVALTEGLGNANVYDVLQDNKGFIWITTSAGLSRYDGYNFKFYGYNATDSGSISAGWFHAVYDTKRNLIWIAGQGGQGIYSFDIATEKFTHYQHRQGNNNSVAGDLTHYIAIDNAGVLWLTTMSGINSFDPEKKSFRLYGHIDGDNSTLYNSHVIRIQKDDDGNLWLVMSHNSTDHVDEFDPRTGKVTMHVTDGSSFLPDNNDQPVEYNIYNGRNGNVWITSDNNGLYGYNIHSKKIIHFTNVNDDTTTISKGGNAVLEDGSGNLWFCTSDNKLDYYDSLARKFYHLSIFNIPSGSYSDKIIFQDKSGKIWLATEDEGLYAFNPIQKKIYKITSASQSLSSDDAICILQTKAGQVLLGTAAGVDILNKNGKASPFAIMENGKDISQHLGGLWYIYQDRQGMLWLCTEYGLLSFDPQTKKHRWYKHDDNDSTTISGSSCTGIIEDLKGRYWVTAWTAGFDSFDPVSGKFSAYEVNDGPNSISTNDVANLVESATGNIYIGSWDGGFVIFNPDNKTFKAYKHSARDSSSLSSNIAFDCYESKNGIVWVCTNGGGINAFDPVTKKFKAFTTRDGLVNNGVTSITADDKGDLWLGTVRGISCFSPPDDPFAPGCKIKFRNYDVGDGLPGNQIYLCSAYKGNDGSMYFATESKGFFYFHPEELKDNPYVPPVYITAFSLFNHPVEANDASKILSSQIENTKEIKLTHDQNIISFSFAALNYIHPEKNQYAYKLENFDKDWVYTDASKRFAYYTNLDPGEYTFEVKGSNNDGVWNETPATIKLIIAPPWWGTWWFRIAVVLAIAGGVYALYRFRLNQILRLQSIRNKIAHDLHDDIGSTLNSISVFSQVAQQEPEKQKAALEMIGESSRKVIEAMSDIVWTINPEHDSFEDIILRMRSFSYNLLRAKNIEHIFRADESLNNLKLSLEDRRNFYLFFKEAVNNLVKHSNASKAEISLYSENHFIVLMIRDNGEGFDTSKEYNGNGIISMRKRAEDMKALLSIESLANCGATIQLKIKT
jgi:ligand-binding sensor domain-containing protein/two-component sensor histidine kinase